MIPHGVPYEEAMRQFRWPRPQRFNIGRAVCERHPSPRAGADRRECRRIVRNWTFGELLAASSRLANALDARGIGKGDRVGVFLSQGAELTLCHLAGYRMGAVVLPLFTLFGEEALEYRLANAEASALITDMSQLPKVLAVRDRLPHLKTIIVIGAGAHGGAFLDWDRLLAAASDSFATVDTAAEDPALLIYTSGTTGQPKGALHAHRVMLGSMPPVEQWLSHWPRGNEVMWTPAEWAWIAGLYDALFPAWFYGTPVVAHRFAKFDPERAFALLERHKVGVGFIPPTALKMMRQVDKPRERWRLRRARRLHRRRGDGRGTAGLGPRHVRHDHLGRLRPDRDEPDAAELARLVRGAAGLVRPRLPRPQGRHRRCRRQRPAARRGRPDRRLAARSHRHAGVLAQSRGHRAPSIAGDWLLTGDLGRIDEEGYVFFKSRDDDVITSGGYRIGPGEIEECLMEHPAVAMVGVVGVPDPVRTEIVKAFVQLRPEIARTEALKADLASYVKTRLAAHEYPREVEFVAELPLTTTGKIMRRELRQLDAERKGSHR